MQGTCLVESKDLLDIISKLDKDYYFITYEYDEDGYINTMNIKDV